MEQEQTETDWGAHCRKLIEQQAHDLNGEIFLIRGYTELLEARLQEQPELLDLMHKIHQRTDALAETVKQCRHELVKALSTD